VNAQSVGLRGGLQQTNIVTDEASNTFGTETGFTVGGFLKLNLPANLSLSAEAMYAQKFITQQNVETDGSLNLSPDATLELGTLEIPILLSYNVPVSGALRPRVYGGPVIGVVVNDQIDLDGKSVGDIANEAVVLTGDAFSEREVGWLVGGGATLSLASLGVGSMYLLADVRYANGITRMSEDFTGNPLNQQITFGAFSALLGVGF
jgi:hypothetical protein